MTHRMHPPVGTAEPLALAGSTHVSVVKALPEVLRSFGVEPADALQIAGVRADLFDNPKNTIEYARFEQLLVACERLTQCDHIGLLIGRHTRLADFGLAGRAALCGTTAGDGLQNFIDHFNLHSTATTVNLVSAGPFSRLIYAISVSRIVDAAQLHLGAVTVAFNILQDLFGRQWLPVAVTFATRAPTSLRPCQEFFRSPLRFDSDESAVVFDSHWLQRPMPPVDAGFRSEVEGELRTLQEAQLADLPAIVRRLLRKQMSIGASGMDAVAALLGMHRRTLDRHLQKHGVRFGELREDVRRQVAEQLLHDTRMQVQNIAAALQFSTAANFATAFRRWTGITPSEYRRRGR